MGRFVTLDGARTGPAVHVVDPGVPLDALITDPLDVWRTQPSVRKVVDFIARNLASIPIHVYQRDADDSRKRIRSGGLADILGAPAPFTTPYRFWHTIHCDGLLWDRWAFVRLTATRDEPEMLFRLPPGRFRILRGAYNEPETLVVWPKKGEEYHLGPGVAVFDAGYSSAWNNVTPPIDTLADTLHEAAEARKYRRDLLRNGARVDRVIERPKDAGKWDDAAWNRFKSQFSAYRAGGGEEGGVPILEDGMTLTKVEAFEPQKLEVIEARKLTDAEVASFYHVPPEMVGAREGNYSNLDAFRQMLWSVTLGPQIVAWEQALNVMLKPMYDADDLYVEAHVDAKLRGSFLEQAQAMQSATGAPWMLRSEARSKHNLPHVDGTDDLITPLNVLVGGLASPRDTAPKSRVEGKAPGRA